MSRGARLLVVDPSTSWPEEQGVSVVRRFWPGPSRVWSPALDGTPLPPAPVRAFDAVVVLGSRASVHDAAPWRSALDDAVGPVARGDLDLPLLGVCFGHQWLAHLNGGRVGPANADGDKVVGVEDTIVSPGTLFDGGARLRVVVSHRESVHEAPPGYRVVGTRPTCAIDVIEHDSARRFGVQFHPEAREQFARSAGIEAAGIDRRLRVDSGRVLRAFVAVAVPGRTKNEPADDPPARARIRPRGGTSGSRPGSS